MERLYLDSQLIDLPKKPIIRKIQIGEIGDISSRKSTFSYSVKIPRTANNNKILEMLGVIGNTSRKPYESIRADYIVDGLPLVSNGNAIIKETSGVFELNIFDGLINLSDRLSGKKMAALQFSDLDHYLTTQTYIDSFSNTEGYIYAIADFGLGIATDIKVETQSVSIYAHTLFRKIFEQNGINLVGDFFTTNLKYLTEVVTPSKGYDIVDTAFTSTAKGGVDTNELLDNQVSKEPIVFDEKFDLTGISLVGASISSNNILFSVAGSYKLDFTTVYVTSRTFMNLIIKKNGSTIANINLTGDGASGTKESSVVFNVGIGDYISYHISGSSDFFDPDSYEINYTVSVDSLLFLQEGGQLISVTDYIGDLNQLDFVKDIIRRYGLILHPIKNTADYNFEQIENILNDKENAEDWTSKVKAIGKENYSSGYAQINKAVFKYPEEIVIPNNDGEMLIDNSNIAIEKTMISSPFEIPNISGTYKGETVYLIPIWETVDAVTELRETSIKIMRINRADVDIKAALFTEASTIDVSVDIPFLSLVDMSMQYSLDNNYTSFQALINDYNEKEFELYLSVIDIFNLNFFKLKYFKQTGRYYYLDTVLHSAGKVSKCKLIEITEFI